MSILLSIHLLSCDMSLDSTGNSLQTPTGDLTNSEYPYISQVFDYCYGVGQHSEAHPSIRALPTDADKFIGTDSDYVLLGGWGGYIVGGFDHDVLNGQGHDFAVFTQPGTGNEQAVVYVMDDENGNGKPDETWYELSGSDTGADYSAGEQYSYSGGSYDQARTVVIPPDPLNKYIRNYELTYHKADSSLPEDDPAYGNVTWTDNQGNKGILKPGHGQKTSELWWWPYYGEGVRSKTFRGVKLPHNKFTPDGKFWWDYKDRLSWGYGENYEAYGARDSKMISFGKGEREANCLDISRAVDSDGNPKELKTIRFIKVQTGVFLQAGWLNEISTEISGAVDLRSEGVEIR